MNIIEVQCPACRHTEQVLPQSLLVDLNEPATDSGCHASVCWICDDCGDLVCVRLDWPSWLTVVATGAWMIDGDADEARPVNPETAVEGAPLTMDDLIELHEELSDGAWRT